ncbi:hypothetical protein CLU82_0991 [Flavobacterium sp. 5]|nr:hypothetical protein CLU82_0991 [Flavobacterium sp. 5]
MPSDSEGIFLYNYNFNLKVLLNTEFNFTSLH